MIKLRILIIILITIFTLGLLVVSLALADDNDYASLTEYVEANGVPDLSSGTSPSNSPAVGRFGGLTIYTDRGIFDSTFPGLPLEDFEEGNVAPGGLVGCPAPLSSSSNNVCFSTGDILPGITFVDNPGPDVLDGLVLVGAGFGGATNTKNIVTNSFTDSMDILFDPGQVSAAGMDLTSYLLTDVVTITVYGPDGGLLGTMLASTSNDGLFWGVSSDQYISRINIHTLIAAEGVDNIAFGSEPSIIMTKTVGLDPSTCATTEMLTVDPGTDVYYCYSIKNTSPITLSSHFLYDDKLGAFGPLFFDLEPGTITNTVAGGLEFSATIFYTTTNTAVWEASNNIDATIGFNGGRYTDTATVYVDVPSCVSKPVFKDKFESGLGDWSLSGLWNEEGETDNCGSLVAPFPSPDTAVYYGLQSTCTFSTTNANEGELSMIVGADLSDSVFATMNFASFEETECGPNGDNRPFESGGPGPGQFCSYDVRTVDVSTDGGANWTNFWTSTGPETTWYTSTIGIPFDEPDIRARFVFSSGDDIANDYFGWMVDNVSFTGCYEPSLEMTKTVGTDPNTCASANDITVPAGGGGADVTYCYTVQNTSAVTLTDHDLQDDRLGTLFSGFYPLGPGESYALTTTVHLTGTTYNVATWTASIDNFSIWATSNATVTRGLPTNASLISFEGSSAALTHLWLVALFAGLVGLGLVLRRKIKL